MILLINSSLKYLKINSEFYKYYKKFSQILFFYIIVILTMDHGQRTRGGLFMATQSFDNTIKVNKKTLKSFNNILESTDKVSVSKTSIAKIKDAKSIKKYFEK